MARFQQQALVEAPIERVWGVLADPARYPDWAGDSIETTGYPTQIEKGSTFDQTTRGPLGRRQKTKFEVAELDDLHEIKLQCKTSGYYAHWRLTEAQGQTFADVEIGIEPIGIQGQVARLMFTRSALREVVDESLDGLKRATET